MVLLLFFVSGAMAFAFAVFTGEISIVVCAIALPVAFVGVVRFLVLVMTYVAEEKYKRESSSPFGQFLHTVTGAATGLVIAMFTHTTGTFDPERTIAFAVANDGSYAQTHKYDSVGEGNVLFEKDDVIFLHSTKQLEASWYVPIEGYDDIAMKYSIEMMLVFDMDVMLSLIKAGELDVKFAHSLGRNLADMAPKLNTTDAKDVVGHVCKLLEQPEDDCFVSVAPKYEISARVVDFKHFQRKKKTETD